MLLLGWGLWLALLIHLAPGVALPATYPVYHLDYVVAVDPPHHEYISGRFDKAMAERLYLEIKPSIEYKRLRYHISLIGHGVQEWQSSEHWGSTSDYWTNAEAWKIDEMRYDISHGGTFNLIGESLQIYSDFMMPINRHEYNGVYYWRVGVSGRLF